MEMFNPYVKSVLSYLVRDGWSNIQDGRKHILSKGNLTIHVDFKESTILIGKKSSSLPTTRKEYETFMKRVQAYQK